MQNKRYLPFLLLISTSFLPDAYAQMDKIKEFYREKEKQSKDDPQTIHFINEGMGLTDDFDNLNQIMLLRHGEPALNKKGRRTRKEAMQFVYAYDTVGIYDPSFIPVKIVLGELKVIHTSSIERSISTARLVFKQEELQQPDSLFREFERKIFSFPNIKLGLNCWLNGSRVLWFMGLNKKGIESFSKAKKRAREGAAFLERDATENGKTLLVSHGLLNHFLVKYLKRNGWTEVYDGGKGYLSQKLLVRYRK